MFATDFRRIENGKMGCHAGCPAGNAWHQAFAASAEAGKIVQADCAGHYHPVSFDDTPVDLHRQAA